MTTPLVSADCDLRDFAFMPLDVVRLRDSDISAISTGDEFRSAVLLWCASWHQIPAASLPDDDIILCQLAGYGRVVKEWKKVREGALRGWVKCDDGRLYHPVVAEKAREAWQRKLEQAWKSECARIKKMNQRHETSVPYPTLDDFLSPGYVPPKVVHVPDLSPGTNAHCPQGQPGTVPNDMPGTGHPIDRDSGQGQREVNPSEANASGGEPPKPLTPDEIIFGYGLPLLVSAGTPDKQARSFLGGLRKNHGDEALIDKLRDCLRAKPLQPLEWLAAALPPPAVNGRGKPSRHTGFEKIDYTAGVSAEGKIL